MGDNPNEAIGNFNKVIMDDLAPMIQELRDVGLLIAGIFVGFNVTHFKMRVTKNDLGDKTYEILDTIFNVNILINFPSDTPIAFGSQAQFLEDLLPIKMMSQFVQEFKLGDVVEVFRKDIYGAIFVEKYELVNKTQFRTQSELHNGYDLAPFRQDIKGETKDTLKAVPVTEEIMKVSDNDEADDPIKDTNLETADDDVLLAKENRDTVDPFDEI